jgi:hypothetical protein
MPSPLPGVDPFLEDQHYWPDFHATFVPAFREALTHALPDGYEARIEEQVEILTADPERSALIRADVAVVRDSTAPPRTTVPQTAGGGVAVLEAVPVPFPVMEEVRERWINIIHRPTKSLVAVLEVLSPSNKSNPGRGQYLAKRSRLFMEDLHLVEVDLLVGGERLPMGKPLPRGDFYVITARADGRPNAEVYAWNLRDRLPVVPIPLRTPDPDILIDLADVYATAYDRGPYARSVDYTAELSIISDPDTKRWARQLANRTGR